MKRSVGVGGAPVPPAAAIGAALTRRVGQVYQHLCWDSGCIDDFCKENREVVMEECAAASKGELKSSREAGACAVQDFLQCCFESASPFPLASRTVYKQSKSTAEIFSSGCLQGGTAGVRMGFWWSHIFAAHFPLYCCHKGLRSGVLPWRFGLDDLTLLGLAAGGSAWRGMNGGIA